MPKEDKSPFSDVKSEERAVLVGVMTDADEADSMELILQELRRLCETAHLSVIAELTQVLPRPNSATCIGKGKLTELAELCEAQETDVVVFDYDLSPSQIANIEDALPEKTHVIDRTMLILDIFAANATSGEGMLQVEIAQLKYNVPRLTGRGKELSRLGGGIGTRGPGESKLETDRRHVRRRIAALEERLGQLAASRKLRRNARDTSPGVRITIAGYTNAGKSTLLNYLTGAGILAEDKLFATLDPTTRRMKMRGVGEVLLTDTVGFIDRLPHHLVEAFASTLDEVVYADLLLVVLDASAPDPDRQFKVTRELVASLFEARGLSPVRTVYVYNKCDLVNKEDILLPTDQQAEECVFLSARTGEGVEDLISAVARVLAPFRSRTHFSFPLSEADKVDMLYRLSGVESAEYTENTVEIYTYADEKTCAKYRTYIVEEQG